MAKAKPRRPARPSVVQAKRAAVARARASALARVRASGRKRMSAAVPAPAPARARTAKRERTPAQIAATARMLLKRVSPNSESMSSKKKPQSASKGTSDRRWF